MIAGIGPIPLVLWWLALLAFYLVVVPVVVLIANRLVIALRQIRDYTADILEHGVGVAGNLDPVPELLTTRELVGRIAEDMGRYAAALDRLIEEPG